MHEDLHALAHELHSRFASLIPVSKRGGRLRTTDVRAVLEALAYWHSTGGRHPHPTRTRDACPRHGPVKRGRGS